MNDFSIVKIILLGICTASYVITMIMASVWYHRVDPVFVDFNTDVVSTNNGLNIHTSLTVYLYAVCITILLLAVAIVTILCFSWGKLGTTLEYLYLLPALVTMVMWFILLGDTRDSKCDKINSDKLEYSIKCLGGVFSACTTNSVVELNKTYGYPATDFTKIRCNDWYDTMSIWGSIQLVMTFVANVFEVVHWCRAKW